MGIEGNDIGVVRSLDGGKIDAHRGVVDGEKYGMSS